MNEENNYKVKCTIPTFILFILFYTLLIFSAGVLIGILTGQKSFYIQHYHGDESGFIPQNNVDIDKEITNKETKTKETKHGKVHR